MTGSVNVAVGKATPAVTWPTASSIVYGETLSSSVLAGGSALNGATSVAGTFAFTVPTTVPPAGNSTQSVTFTPTDTADYVSVTGSVSVNVIKGKYDPHLADRQRYHLRSNPGVVYSDRRRRDERHYRCQRELCFHYTNLAPAGIQTESVTFTPTDTTNYSVVTGTVNVTVNKAAPTITWPAASVIVHGQTLASSTLSGGSAVSGATSVAGTFAFATPTTVPADGNVAESVIFTPTDSTDYASVTGSVNVTVLDLTITATPAAQTGTAGGTFTYTIALAPSATGTPYPGPDPSPSSADRPGPRSLSRPPLWLRMRDRRRSPCLSRPPPLRPRSTPIPRDDPSCPWLWPSSSCLWQVRRGCVAMASVSLASSACFCSHWPGLWQPLHSPVAAATPVVPPKPTMARNTPSL